MSGGETGLLDISLFIMPDESTVVSSFFREPTPHARLRRRRQALGSEDSFFTSSAAIF